MLMKTPEGTDRDVGNVTIPQSTRMPSAGEIMEVQYLYVHPGIAGKLAQPVFLGIREDADPADCTTDKLKSKAA